MTREEIIKKMDEIENSRFFLAMKDHWTRADFEIDDKWFDELLELKKELEKTA